MSKYIYIHIYIFNLQELPPQGNEFANIVFADKCIIEPGSVLEAFLGMLITAFQGEGAEWKTAVTSRECFFNSQI